MAKGEENGKTTENSSIALPGWVIAKVARKKTMSCIIVTGIESVCTSRTVVAIEPIERNTAPSSR